MTATKTRKSQKTASKVNGFSQPRDNFLTVNRELNVKVPENRHSKLARTAKSLECNRPSLNLFSRSVFIKFSVELKALFEGNYSAKTIRLLAFYL